MTFVSIFSFLRTDSTGYFRSFHRSFALFCLVQFHSHSFRLHSVPFHSILISTWIIIHLWLINHKQNACQCHQKCRALGPKTMKIGMFNGHLQYIPWLFRIKKWFSRKSWSTSVFITAQLIQIKNNALEANILAVSMKTMQSENGATMTATYKVEEESNFWLICSK